MLSVLPRRWYLLMVPLTGMAFGRYLDKMETERLVLFRDKSALYGRKLEEGQKPTWP